ncbi:hypothetical protein CDIK_0956, partial [Cucumispora dikerogammari]
MIFIYSTLIMNLSKTNIAVYCSPIQPTGTNISLSVIENERLYENEHFIQDVSSRLQMYPIKKNKLSPASPTRYYNVETINGEMSENKSKPLKFSHNKQPMSTPNPIIQFSKPAKTGHIIHSVSQDEPLLSFTQNSYTKEKKCIRTPQCKQSTSLSEQHIRSEPYKVSAAKSCGVKNTCINIAEDEQQLPLCYSHKKGACQDYHKYKSKKALLISKTSVNECPQEEVTDASSSFSNKNFDVYYSAVPVDLPCGDQVNEDTVVENITSGFQSGAIPVAYHREKVISRPSSEKIYRFYSQSISFLKSKNVIISIGTCVFVILIVVGVCLYLFVPWPINTAKTYEISDNGPPCSGL